MSSSPQPCRASLITAAALLNCCLSGCSEHSLAKSEPGAKAPGESSLVTVHPRHQTIARLVVQPGYLRPYEQTPIYSKIAGYVQDVKVDIGDHVHKGDILARLWVPEMEQDLASKTAKIDQADAQVQVARKSLDAAEANVATSQALIKEAAAGIDRARAEKQRWLAEYERGKRMMAGNAYDKQTVDETLNQLQASTAGMLQANARLASAQAALAESEAKRKKAEADVAAAQANAQVARADREQSAAWLNYRDIRAPYDGIVTNRNIHTGHFLQSSSSGSTNKSAEPLFTVMRSDIMRVTVQVPESDTSLVKVGSVAIVRLPALLDREIHGTVTRFTWALDEKARTLRVEIHLKNPENLLHPGMYCKAEIETEVPDALVLPAAAVFTDGERDYCFIIEDGKAVKTALKLGVHGENVVQVLGKLARSTAARKKDEWLPFSGKEEVVAANPESLIDGQAVTVAVSK